MSPCIFCRIADGSVPADVVHRDEEIMAFRDINPQAPLHVLVVPRRHLTGLLETDDEALLGRLLLVAGAVARREGVAAGGFRLVINTNRDAGQSVDHLHVHVLGGRPMTWPPG